LWKLGFRREDTVEIEDEKRGMMAIEEKVLGVYGEDGEGEEGSEEGWSKGIWSEEKHYMVA
jgi:hypothetical protein